MHNRIIQPYLFFSGRCEEAIEFYRKTLGAEVEMLMRFRDNPEPDQCNAHPPASMDNVMHASLRIGESVLMVSDGCEEGSTFSGFSLSISLPSEDEVRSVFSALGESGTITMPLTKTFWSPCFGMLSDKFGVGWMVGVDPEM